MVFTVAQQGVIPLGGAIIDRMIGLRNGLDAISVRHPSFGGRQLVVSADSAAELKRWEVALQQCRLVYVISVLLRMYALFRFITPVLLAERLKMRLLARARLSN